MSMARKHLCEELEPLFCKILTNPASQGQIGGYLEKTLPLTWALKAFGSWLPASGRSRIGSGSSCAQLPHLVTQVKYYERSSCSDADQYLGYKSLSFELCVVSVTALGPVCLGACIVPASVCYDAAKYWPKINFFFSKWERDNNSCFCVVIHM